MSSSKQNSPEKPEDKKAKGFRRLTHMEEQRIRGRVTFYVEGGRVTEVEVVDKL